MLERYNTIVLGHIRVSIRTAQIFIHQSRASQSGKEEFRGSIRHLCTSLTVGLKLLVKREVLKWFCKVRDHICIPEGRLNGGRLPIDYSVIVVRSSSTTKIFLLWRSGWNTVGVAAFWIRRSFEV
jgi:hypothetical protein